MAKLYKSFLTFEYVDEGLNSQKWKQNFPMVLCIMPYKVVLK